jgi:hypothetical protein
VALALAAIGWSHGAAAQETPAAPETLAVGDWRFTPVAEARLRLEYRHWLGDEDSGLLVERARLGIDAEQGVFEGRVVFQDARTLDLGRGSHIAGGPLPLAVTGAYEAWGEARTPSRDASFVRAGRQAVTWGEGRLLGSADWLSTGRTLDGLRGRLVVADSAFELLAAVLTDPSVPTIAAYGELFGARAELALDPLLAFEAYGLARLAHDNPLESLDSTVKGETYVLALRAHGDRQEWVYGAEGAYELGHVDVLAEDRGAWAAAGHMGYRFYTAGPLDEARIAGSFASGDGGGATYRAFDPLLPDLHTWHGSMDLFAWSNEAEVSARASFVLGPAASATLEYRYARLANASGTWRTGYLATIGSAPGNSRAELGHEIDAALSWSPCAPADFSLSYSLFLPGSGARAVLDAAQIGVPQAAHFAYLEAAFHLP